MARQKLTPEEREARRKAQGRERARRRREREKTAASASPDEQERLRSKWRAEAKKAYAREKDARERSPDEQKKFRAKWREKAAKAVEREVAGRSVDAPEKLRRLAQRKKEYRRRYAVERYSSDLHHRLTMVLRSRVRSAVRNGQKRGSAIRDLGCTVDELKAHLEAHFSSGMTWETFGHGEGRWSIDHIFPFKRADLTDRAHVLAVCNYRNLQPEWFSDNVRKSARVTPAARALFDELVDHFRRLGSSGSPHGRPRPRASRHT